MTRRSVVLMASVTLFAVLASMIVLAIDVASSPPDPNRGG
jgi:hypothetical protein